MARKKKQSEPKPPTFEEVREPLANFIESMEVFIYEVGANFNALGDTLNENAEAGNNLSENVDDIYRRVLTIEARLGSLRSDLNRIGKDFQAHVSRPTRWQRIKAYFGWYEA